ncbi:MAG: HEAT repeat domain-containing protein [Spirochaetes bacterium]|nr:HEAT repeat domain-containing protein [Spirochaetota bacterium]
MKRHIISELFCIIFISLVFEAYSSAEESIADAVKRFAEGRKPTRVAVLDFAGSGDKNRYGAFIADSIISELGKYKLTLLERKRLELLLKESELAQTGAVDSEGARKLGTLLPVDVVASGSYTEFGGRLVINGRFIHVGTGEIIYAFTASMPVEQSKPVAFPVPGAKPDCEKEKALIKKAMSDLSSESSISKAVETSVSIPFEGECGKVHYDVLYYFTNYKIYPSKYKSFLINTLSSIDNPSDDNRAGEIIRYFASDGVVDNDEWAASLAILKRTRVMWHSVTLGNMLKGSKTDTVLLKARIDEVMVLALDKKIGKPVPAAPEDVLFAAISGLRSYYQIENMEPSAYAFRKYSHIIPDNDKYNKKAADILSTMYFNANKRADQKEILSIIISFFKSRESEVMCEECADLFKSVVAKTDGRNETDKNKFNSYAEDIDVLNRSLGDVYCRSVGAARKKGYRYIVEERELHILRNKMKCSLTPAIRDLEADMRSGDWDKKLVAVEKLSKIGMAAKEAEGTLIKYLGQQGFGFQGGKLRSLCAKTLGNIKTNNQKGIEMLIESFPDYDNGVSHEAEEAIKKIGLPAMPYLIKGLRHGSHAVRFRCAKALGNMGRHAKSALPELNWLSEKDSDPYVRKEAKGAAQMISNDY